jgi:hypothetical protein
MVRATTGRYMIDLRHDPAAAAGDKPPPYGVVGAL